MKKDELVELLRELGASTAERADPSLAASIKEQIPRPLVRQKVGMNTISIIIDLRVGKLAAAAVILLAMFLCAHFFSSRYWRSDNIVQNGKLVAKYLLSGKYPAVENAPVVWSRYDYLREQGMEVVYYGDAIEAKDPNAMRRTWRVRRNR